MREQNRSECRKLLQQMSNFIDNDLSPELCAELEEHFKSCPNCRIVLNTTKRTIELFQESNLGDGCSKEARQKLFSKLNLNQPNKEK